VAKYPIRLTKGVLGSPSVCGDEPADTQLYAPEVAGYHRAGILYFKRLQGVQNWRTRAVVGFSCVVASLVKLGGTTDPVRPRMVSGSAVLGYPGRHGFLKRFS
jgi:hypothetical protein